MKLNIILSIIKVQEKYFPGGDIMVFPVSSALLDALVLSVVSTDDTYGYKITQEITSAIEMSESTLYPVLRRLLKSGSLKSYDKEYLGRNRRYYSITAEGLELLSQYRSDWVDYKLQIDDIIGDIQTAAEKERALG
jgi:PadR family transcriptional regulator PadR